MPAPIQPRRPWPSPDCSASLRGESQDTSHPAQPPKKRLDLFVNERELEKVCKAIRQAGAPGYSVMRHVTGMGVGGEISEAMDFSDFGANGHVIVFCAADLLPALREQVSPLLARYGGVGFVSEAEAF